jgi:hypothetical protein
MSSPSYHTMSLVELKKAAQTRSIKMYYTKKRSELIQLLSMKELPASFVIEKFTILELRTEAKKRGMRGFWKLTRDQLVALLYPDGTLGTNQKDYDSEKDEDPQSNDTHDVGV